MRTASAFGSNENGVGPVLPSAGLKDFVGENREVVAEVGGKPAQNAPIREDGRTSGDSRIAADIVLGELVRERYGDMVKLHHSQVSGHPEERVGTEHAHPGTFGQI